MSKLTNKQKFALEETLRHLKRGYNYIHSKDVVICHKAGHGGTTLHFSRKQPPAVIDDGNGEFLFPLAKHSSDLVGLEMAIERLELFINGPTIEEV